MKTITEDLEIELTEYVRNRYYPIARSKFEAYNLILTFIKESKCLNNSFQQPQPEKTVDEEKILILFSKYANIEHSPSLSLPSIPCITRSAFVEAIKEYGSNLQQPQPITMWDVNHMGAREMLTDFIDWYYKKGIINHPLYLTKVAVDEYIEHKKKEK